MALAVSSTTLFASLGVLNGFAGSIVHKGKTTVGLTVIGLVIAFVGAVHLFISDGKKKLLRLSFAFLVVAGACFSVYAQSCVTLSSIILLMLSCRVCSNDPDDWLGGRREHAGVHLPHAEHH